MGFVRVHLTQEWNKFAENCHTDLDESAPRFMRAWLVISNTHTHKKVRGKKVSIKLNKRKFHIERLITWPGGLNDRYFYPPVRHPLPPITLPTWCRRLRQTKGHPLKVILPRALKKLKEKRQKKLFFSFTWIYRGWERNLRYLDTTLGGFWIQNWIKGKFWG